MENAMAIFYCFVIVCYQKWHWNKGIISYDCVHNLFFPEGVHTLTHQYGFITTMCVAFIHYLHSNFHFKKLYSHPSVHFDLTKVFMLLLQVEYNEAWRRNGLSKAIQEITWSWNTDFPSLKPELFSPNYTWEEDVRTTSRGGRDDFFYFSYWLAVLSPTPSPNDLEMLN